MLILITCCCTSSPHHTRRQRLLRRLDLTRIYRSPVGHPMLNLSFLNGYRESGNPAIVFFSYSLHPHTKLCKRKKKKLIDPHGRPTLLSELTEIEDSFASAPCPTMPHFWFLTCSVSYTCLFFFIDPKLLTHDKQVEKHCLETCFPTIYNYYLLRDMFLDTQKSL